MSTSAKPHIVGLCAASHSLPVAGSIPTSFFFFFLLSLTENMVYFAFFIFPSLVFSFFLFVFLAQTNSGLI